jgi:hypothetical protein
MNRNSKLVFILYDNAFIDKHKKKAQSGYKGLAAKGEEDKDWVTIGILAHELGHILCRHVDDSSQTNPHQSELQADEWIGVALRKMGASLSQAQQCMQGSSIEPKGGHPGRAQRFDAIKYGYYHYDLPKAIRSFHDKDFELAYKILTNNDLKLNAEGYWCLGQLQEYGRGGADKDTHDALKSYENAIRADSNYCPAYEGLARLSKPNKKFFLKWQNKAALHNCPDGLLYMGFEMERSDPVYAAKLYKKATLHGSPRAWHNLGSLYETGKGVAENFQEALKCYQKAASLGWQQSIDYLKDRGLPLK